MNLLIKELVYIIKHHLSLILVVLMAAGILYFLIPYTFQELTGVDLYTSFLPRTGVSSQELAKMPSSVKANFLKLSKEEQIKIAQELKDLNKKIKQKGGLWQASYTSVSVKNSEEQKKLCGLVAPTEEQEKKSKEILDKRKQKKLKEISTKPANTLGALIGPGDSLPDFFDWRNVHGQNYVTPIRDQLNCGSCWAFGAVAALEGAINAYYNNPNLDPDLSEQDLISCFFSYEAGCLGATSIQVKDIFNSYYQSTGITTESCFNYTAIDTAGCNAVECGFPPTLCSDKCANWEDDKWITSSYVEPSLADADNIKRALIENGPLEVGMIVYCDLFDYASGIYSPAVIDVCGYHAVTIVGYGVYDGLDYWIVKNSWGTDWGESGYFRILANTSWIDTWFAFGVVQPIPNDVQEILCTDNDADGYCNWGLGGKPAFGCPICDDNIMDCDDSDPAVYQDCGILTQLTGSLSIASAPSNAEVYIKDPYTQEFVYRGNTPLATDLEIGQREIKMTKYGYFDYVVSVNIEDGQLVNLDITLDNSPEFQEGFPADTYPYSNIGYLVAGDIDGDGVNELIAEAGNSSLSSKKIFVWNGKGELNEDIAQLDFSTGLPPHCVLSLIDIDGYPGAEILTPVQDLLTETSMVIALKHDGSLAQAWNMHTFDQRYIYGRSPIMVADIDGQPDEELIFLTAGKYSWELSTQTFVGDPAIAVLNKNGSLKYESYLPEAYSDYQAIGTYTFVGDLDGSLDGNDEKEIGVTFRSTDQSIGLFLFNGSDGSMVDGNFPIIIEEPDQGGVFTTNLLVGDVDGDGTKEILWGINERRDAPPPDFVTTYTGKILVYNYDGTLRNTFIVKPEQKYVGWDEPFALGHIDDNETLDILTGRYLPPPTLAYERDIIALDGNTGEQLAGNWPIPVPEFDDPQRPYFQGNSLIGDIDNNEDKEVMVTFYSFGKESYDVEGYMGIWNHDGASWQGEWLKYIDGFPWPSTGSLLTDIDNDGDIELAVSYWKSTENSGVAVWDLGGSYNPDKIEWGIWRGNAQHTGCYELPGEPQSCLPPDLNCDKSVDFTDFNLFKDDWGQITSLADFNQDGIVDTKDLGTLMNQWTD